MISEERLKELLVGAKKLEALEAGGVDNWEGYEEALEEFNREMEADEKLKELVDAIFPVFGRLEVDSGEAKIKLMALLRARKVMFGED